MYIFRETHRLIGYSILHMVIIVFVNPAGLIKHIFLLFTTHCGPICKHTHKLVITVYCQDDRSTHELPSLVFTPTR